MFAGFRPRVVKIAYGVSGRASEDVLIGRLAENAFGFFAVSSAVVLAAVTPLTAALY